MPTEIAVRDSLRAMYEALRVLVHNLALAFTSRVKVLAIGRCMPQFRPGTVLTFDKQRTAHDGDVVLLELDDPEHGEVMQTKRLRWTPLGWYATSEREGIVPLQFCGTLVGTLVSIAARPASPLFERMSDAVAVRPESLAWGREQFADAYRWLEAHPTPSNRPYPLTS